MVLTPDEEALYRLAFRSLGRRKFARFAGLGRWGNAEKDQELSKEGERVDEIMALISGKIAAPSETRPSVIWGLANWLVRQVCY